MRKALLVLSALPFATLSAQTAPDTSWVQRSALYEVFVRDFSATGDLRGVTAGLDRIQAVGANVIWLMPIYPVGVLNHKGELGSPYAVRDYQAIDPALGTESDFRDLIRAAHNRGMHVILDWVSNRTARDHSWVKEHPDWYGHDTTGNADVAQLDYRNPDLAKSMIGAMKYWISTYQVDGFRMDAADLVPDAFWQQCIPALRAASRETLMLVAGSGDVKMHHFGFDLTPAADSYQGLKDVWQGKPASAWVEREIADQKALPRGGARIRFTTNQDETAWDKPPVILFGGAPGARAAYLAEALLPGRPEISNGQEVESPQTLNVFAKQPIQWDQPDRSAIPFYHRIISLDLTDPSFFEGPLDDVGTSAPADLIAYVRGDALVVVNVRNHPIKTIVRGYRVKGATNLLTNAVVTGDTLDLPSYGAVVLER